MKTRTRTRKPAGYTFAEVLMAAALLGVMFGGTVSLLGTMNTVETSARGNAVALNLLDCAARLWQLGLSPAEALAVLPSTTNNEMLDKSVVVNGNGTTVTYGTAGTTNLSSSMGTVENISVTVTVEDPQGTNNRAASLTAYRPTAR